RPSGDPGRWRFAIGRSDDRQCHAPIIGENRQQHRRWSTEARSPRAGDWSSGRDQPSRETRCADGVPAKFNLRSSSVATVKVMFSGPGPQANGLSATDDGIWVCDQKDDRIYLVDYDGRVQTSFATPARNLSGVGFGAGAVWGA